MFKSMQNKIVVVSLILFFPIGILLMFYWRLYSPWVRVFVSASLILISVTVGVSIWQVNKITTNLNNQVNKELLVETASSTSNSKYGFNLPQQDIYQKPLEAPSAPIIANGIEMIVIDLVGHTYTNKISKKVLNYCAVVFSIKNLLTETLTILPDSMFMLSPEGVDLNFPLTGITGLGNFETKPAQPYYGEDKFDMVAGSTKEGFLPFDCPDFKTSYIFQSDINQFYAEVITQELPYKPVRIKMILGSKNQAASSSSAASVSQ